MLPFYRMRVPSLLVLTTGLVALGCSSESVAPPGVNDVNQVLDASDGIVLDTRSVTPNEDINPPEDIGTTETVDDSGPALGTLGSPCDTADSCSSGYCVESADGTVCTQTCDNDCPDGWTCKQTLNRGDPVYICLPNFPTLCMPCMETSDCQLAGSKSYARCLPMGEAGSFCGGDCSAAACPEGYSCKDVADILGEQSQQCVKDDSQCACSELAILKAAKTVCEISNEYGKCGAQRQCLADGLTACEADTPAAEVCDGLDNNCDKSIDEEVTCDDGNVCTQDACGGVDQCVNTPVPGGNCDDNKDTTKDDQCNDTGQCVGTVYSCPELTACTPSYSQDGKGCMPNYAAQGTGCDDNKDTTNQDQCDGKGTCSGTVYTCPNPTLCTPSYTQDGSGCTPSHAEKGTVCNDQAVSTKNDVCDGNGVCEGTGYTCPKATLCTPSYSQDGSGCVPNHAKEGVVCVDGSTTTKEDKCNGSGVCVGTPYTCPKPTPCAPSYTQDGSGCAANYADKGTVCNDDNPATKSDVCNGFGSCFGTPYTCPAVTPCTPNYTQDGSGCTAQHAAKGTGCNDQSITTKNDVCNGFGSCAGTPYSCDKATVCTPGYTQDGSGCIPKHASEGKTCDDDKSSTKDDQCNGFGSCLGTPYTCPAVTPCTPAYTQNGSICVAKHATQKTQCDDKDNTTKNDECNGFGECQGTAYTCPKTTVCTPKYIQNGTECVPQHVKEGTACDDQKTSTKGDVCDGVGGCSGQAYTCPKPTTCTVGYSQDGKDCIAQYAAQGKACNDKDNTTKNDVCDGQGGCAGTNYTCDKPSVCTPSYTQDGNLCIPNHAKKGTECNDGDNTTKDDVCNNSGVCSGDVYTCPKPTTCTTKYTQDGAQCVPTYAAKTTVCDDNKNNTKDDVCDGAGVCAGTVYTCDKVTACTPSYSQDGKLCIANHAPEGTPCTDGDNTTKLDVCKKKGLCVGTPYTCDKVTTCTPSYSQDGKVCIANHAKEGTPCNDQKNTTKLDACNNKGLCVGQPYTCPKTSQCTPGYNQDGSDCIAQHKVMGTACDDGKNTTKDDICDGQGGCAGEDYNCPKPTICIPSHTQNGTGCVPKFAPDGTHCGGPNQCVSGVCTAPVKPVVVFTLHPPSGYSTVAGDSYPFNVSAQDTANLGSTVTYQWYLSTNGGSSYSPISGANKSTLDRYKPFYYSDSGHRIKCRATVTNEAGTTSTDSKACELFIQKKYDCNGPTASGSKKISGGGLKPSTNGGGDQQWGSWSPGYSDICEINGQTNGFKAGGRCNFCNKNGQYKGYELQLQLKIVGKNGQKKHWGDQQQSNGSCGKNSHYQINANGGGWNPDNDGIPTFKLMVVDNGTQCKDGAGQDIGCESDEATLNYSYKRRKYYFMNRP